MHALTTELQSQNGNCMWSLDFHQADAAVSSSIFVGAERKKNLIRNDPDKSEFTIEQI